MSTHVADGLLAAEYIFVAVLAGPIGVERQAADDRSDRQMIPARVRQLVQAGIQLLAVILISQDLLGGLVVIYRVGHIRIIIIRERQPADHGVRVSSQRLKVRLDRPFLHQLGVVGVLMLVSSLLLLGLRILVRGVPTLLVVYVQRLIGLVRVILVVVYVFVIGATAVRLQLAGVAILHIVHILGSDDATRPAELLVIFVIHVVVVVVARESQVLDLLDYVVEFDQLLTKMLLWIEALVRIRARAVGRVRAGGHVLGLG